jgi:hypothetical protein
MCVLEREKEQREKGNKQQQFGEAKKKSEKKCLNNLHVNHDLFIFILV